MSPGTVGALSMLPLGFLPGVSDMLSAPREALFKGLGGAFGSGEGDGSGSGLLQALFGTDPNSGLGRWGGLAAEVAGDPLNLVGAPLAGLAGKGLVRLSQAPKLAELNALREQAGGLATLSRGVENAAAAPLPQAVGPFARGIDPAAEQARFLARSNLDSRSLPAFDAAEAQRLPTGLSPDAGKDALRGAVADPKNLGAGNDLYAGPDLRYFRDATSRQAAGAIPTRGPVGDIPGAAALFRSRMLGQPDPADVERHVAGLFGRLPEIPNPLPGRSDEVYRAANLPDLRAQMLDANALHNDAARTAAMSQMTAPDRALLADPARMTHNPAYTGLTPAEEARAYAAARSSPEFNPRADVVRQWDDPLLNRGPNSIVPLDPLAHYNPGTGLDLSGATRDPFTLRGPALRLKVDQAQARNAIAQQGAAGQLDQISPLLQQLMQVGSMGALGGAAGYRLANGR